MYKKTSIKKLIIVLLAAALTVAADAQPKIGGAFRGSFRTGTTGVYHGGGGYYVRPRVTLISPLYPSYYGLGYGLGLGYGFGYSPFYDPFYSPRMVRQRPSQLDLQIEDIKNDYDYQIDSVKHDKSLAKDERKQKVRDLKHEKDSAIIDAKKSYYADGKQNS